MSRTFHHTRPKYRKTAAPQSTYAYWLRYGHGHNGGKGIGYRANRLERTARSTLRTFAHNIIQTHRAAGDLDSLHLPEARHRHQAIWEYW